MTTFNTPNAELLDRWERGEPITDEELALMEQFFGAMVVGCQALGSRYLLATQALRAEHNRATRTQGYRRS